MTVLVGYPLDRRNKALIQFAAMVARSGGEDLVVCVVVPYPFTSATRRSEETLHEEARRTAQSAFDRARRDLPADIDARMEVRPARTVPRGLIAVAEEVGASMIVCGGATTAVERITLSTVADRLLHGSQVPVGVSSRGLLAPRTRITRVTLAFTGGKGSRGSVAAAQQIADSFGTPLRLAAFAVDAPFPVAADPEARESGVRREWERRMREDAVTAAPAEGPAPEFVIGRGPDWESAIEDVDWDEGDLFLLGSSEQSPVAGVFIGTNAMRILRKAPVPVVVLPRP